MTDLSRMICMALKPLVYEASEAAVNTTHWNVIGSVSLSSPSVLFVPFIPVTIRHAELFSLLHPLSQSLQGNRIYRHYFGHT